jgi:UDP-2,3-diacylglucosamine hydrolase
VTASTKKYFISDFHLGVPDYASSLSRERKVVRWLESVRADASEIYILGDVFDFWFEYRHVVPKGFIRLQGKLAELADAGIGIHYFTGNHDMWIFDYLPGEIGMTLHREPLRTQLGGKEFYIGHGDALGPGDRGYKFIKRVFENKMCQWLFARLHPNFGMALANFWSRRSRIATGGNDEKYLGDDKEYLVQFARQYLQTGHVDYFVFGHRHLPIDMEVAAGSRYVNLGDWITHFTYAVFDGERLSLEKFEG